MQILGRETRKIRECAPTRASATRVCPVKENVIFNGSNPAIKEKYFFKRKKQNMNSTWVTNISELKNTAKPIRVSASMYDFSLVAIMNLILERLVSRILFTYDFFRHVQYTSFLFCFHFTYYVDSRIYIHAYFDFTQSWTSYVASFTWLIHSSLFVHS